MNRKARTSATTDSAEFRRVFPCLRAHSRQLQPPQLPLAKANCVALYASARGRKQCRFFVYINALSLCRHGDTQFHMMTASASAPVATATNVRLSTRLPVRRKKCSSPGYHRPGPEIRTLALRYQRQEAEAPRQPRPQNMHHHQVTPIYSLTPILAASCFILGIHWSCRRRIAGRARFAKQTLL